MANDKWHSSYRRAHLMCKVTHENKGGDDISFVKYSHNVDVPKNEIKIVHDLQIYLSEVLIWLQQLMFELDRVS